MKIAIDPYYTTDLRRCASAIKMYRTLEYLMDVRDDVYAYWLVPEDISDEDDQWLKTLPHYDRIKFLPYTPETHTDRIRGYYTYHEDYERALAWNGILWDLDILITNRTSLVPTLKQALNRPGNKKLYWSRKVVIFEDMPVMSFKGWVSTGDMAATDPLTMLGYYAADLTCICAFWEKEEILKLAKKTFTPAYVRRIRDRIVEVMPTVVDKPVLKDRAVVEAMLNKERPFGVSFSGRMIKGHRFEDIFDLMNKHWIMRGSERMNFMVTTQSNGVGMVRDIPEFVDLKMTDRDAFWDVVRTQSDVGVFMSPEEDFSMSMFEPILLGLPMAVYRAKHAVASLGEDYPFFFKTLNEAYSIIRAFYENYPLYYKKFAEWSQGPFTKLLQERRNEYGPYKIEKLAAQHDAEFLKAKKDDALNKDNDFVQSIAATIKPGETFHLADKVREAGVASQAVAKASAECQRDGWRNQYCTDLKMVTLALKAYHNCVDAGPTPGHLTCLPKNP